VSSEHRKINVLLLRLPEDDGAGVVLHSFVDAKTIENHPVCQMSRYHNAVQTF